MTNPFWVDMLLFLLFILVLVAAFLWGWLCAGGLKMGRRHKKDKDN